ncbi:hypothetical protein Celaphus_00009147 [Cervus elaphus hippelaphus]|uniref:G-protein coupled receptors family 1 profile domain-containing protein n=1 Tax=Cervus elaphus hippelaphus TaxID=46360 RepID=A0A212DHS8_CEREH|nr:hypothetical protein Celaphus_00009147 [Cervus elaphus hippelaphus]
MWVLEEGAHKYYLWSETGIHSWQHWLSLPLTLLYLLALSANILMLIIINKEATLHQPMYHFLGILAVDLGDFNSSKFQVSAFILMGFPGIHSWQHWLSLPLALLYLLALSANILILIIINQEATLHQPMYYFLGILAVVDMGLATTIMPKILTILWFSIHSWQHWLSLPLALLYLLALSTNILTLIIINQEATLHQPMYHFLGILAVVDMGLATTIMPKILVILWLSANTIRLPECFVQMNETQLWNVTPLLECEGGKETEREVPFSAAISLSPLLPTPNVNSPARVQVHYFSME